MIKVIGEIYMKRVIFTLVVLFLNINMVFCADFTTFKLENGHTFIIKPIHTNPIVTIDTWVKTGSINENEFEMKKIFILCLGIGLLFSYRGFGQVPLSMQPQAKITLIFI